jgi:hypothetical protein
MPNLIVAGNSTNGGTSVTTDTSGTLNIVTGSGSGTTAITVDGSQNVTFANAISATGNGTVGGTLAVTSNQTIGGNLTVTGSITGGSISAANSLQAWVNFNGTGTVAIRASNNVSSITDGGVGVYTVNFTTALSDANYAVAGSCGIDTSAGTTFGLNNNTQSTSAVVVTTKRRDTGAGVDQTQVQAVIFR